MSRSPLRPLLRIIAAREKGISPEIIESEEKVKRLKNKIVQKTPLIL